MGDQFYGCDAILNAIFDQLIPPPMYSKDIVRQHLVNFMKLIKDDLEVNNLPRCLLITLIL